MNPSFLTLLRMRWQLVTTLLLLAILMGVGVTLQTTPRFVSTARVFLATPSWNGATRNSAEASPFRGDDFARSRARSYVRMAGDVDLARRVILKLGADRSPEALAGAVTAHLIPDTVLIDVSVADVSAPEAQRLADAVAAELAAQILALETPSGSRIPTVEPVITQTADLPEQPSEPDVWNNLTLAVGLGLLAGVTGAVLIPQRPGSARSVRGPGKTVRERSFR
ncbi:YveK family protein [Nocardia sp. NPDC058497]|uniref:YveK family protein n=1 Tax=Nocardia sp. NPDC058497 TaxID=3346529 RepID=UPI00364D75FE